MDSISPAWLLLAVLVCSMIGRFLLIRAAWEISKPWGFAVLCVPFAPMVFRMKYKELASEGQHWRTLTLIFGVAFMAVTGSTGSIDDLWDIVPQKWRPAEQAEHLAAEAPAEPETASAADEPEERDEEADAVAQAPAGQPGAPVAAANAAPESAPKGFLTRIATLVSPAAAQAATAGPTPSSAPQPAPPMAPAPAPASAPAPSSTAIATLTPPLTVPLTLSQRAAANQAEFARLAEVYEALKKEKGYLKKWDQDQIKAYNESAATYQAALAAARAEQTELMKLVAVAKK